MIHAEAGSRAMVNTVQEDTKMDGCGGAGFNLRVQSLCLRLKNKDGRFMFGVFGAKMIHRKDRKMIKNYNKNAHMCVLILKVMIHLLS